MTHFDNRDKLVAKRHSERARSGFTLVETLMALMIMVILTGLVAMGIPVAFDTYTKSVNASNAKVLLSTTTTVLRDEFSMAQKQALVTESGKEKLYYMDRDGYWASLEIGTNTKNSKLPTITKQLYYGNISKDPDTGKLKSELNTLGGPQKLIPDSALTDALGIRLSGVSYNNGVFTINDLEVVALDRNGSESPYATTGSNAGDDFKIRAVMLREG